MKLRPTRTLTVGLLMLGWSTLAIAGAPTLMNYQGQIDTGGVAFTGTVNMTFSIYDVSTGGTALWTEGHSGVPVQDGLCNVILGSNTALTDATFSGADRWLGITVGADPEMTPRTRITSVAYAHRVNTVDGATGGIISGNTGIQSDLTVSGKAAIGPGNTNTGINAFVAGENNQSSGNQSTVGGGRQNISGNNHTTVSGGSSNNATGLGSAVGGGGSNDATAGYTTIAGGFVNVAMSDGSTVGGGQGDSALGAWSTVSGGLANLAGGDSSVVTGGVRNRSTGVGASVGGGFQNTAEGEGATVGGGTGNRVAPGFYSTVGGGIGDTANGWYNTIAGGQGNITTNNYSAIAGGGFNTASGFAASVGGGQTNQATGDYATAPGGQSNRAFGDHSMASGFRAVATHDGSYVWADETNADFTSTGPDQYLIRATGGVGIGTDAPTQPLEVAGTIYTSAGGVKFPDGTVQTTAASGGSSGSFGTSWAVTNTSTTMVNLQDRGRMETYGVLKAFRIHCQTSGGNAYLEYFVELYDQGANTWTYYDGVLSDGGIRTFTSLPNNPGTAIKITLTDANDGYVATWTGTHWNDNLAGTWITSSP